MGITNLTLEALNQVLENSNMSYDNMKMCELGNQWLFLNPDSGIPYKSSAKPYFESKGVDHTSIDINGEDGALPIDLSEEIDRKFRNKFDVVTNFGTSEHVSSFYQVLRNIHLLCRKDGIIFNVTPLTGHWPNHGQWYATENFIKQLAEEAQYEILYLNTIPAQHNVKTGMEVVSAFRKTSYQFVSESDFNEMEFYTE